MSNKNLENKNSNVLTMVASTTILGHEIDLYGSVEHPLFVAKDVAEWIDYAKNPNGSRQTSKMLKGVDDDEKLVVTLLLPDDDQAREYNVLTEDGLYEVCMTSRKPVAKEMKKEIKNYLKSIRLTGAAIEDGREMEMIKKYFPSFSEETQMAMFADLMETKAQYDLMINSEGLYHMNLVAKNLEIGRNTLYSFLREHDVMFYEDGVNVPYQRFMNEGKFKVKQSMCADGNFRPVTYATKSGMDYIAKLLKKYGFYDKAVA